MLAQVVSDLLQPEGSGVGRLHRLKRFLDTGIVGCSEFSGWDSHQEALRCVTLAFEQHINQPVRGGFAWAHATDWDSLCSSVLCQKSAQEGNRWCVFEDIMDRLEDAKPVLSAMRPE
eukprot:1943366-Lingulodinium_polyedra.AAC.1